jgi:hypothetical protein
VIGTGCTTSNSNTGRKISSDLLANFYVAMNCEGEVYVTSSRDLGATFSAPISVGITGITEVAVEGGGNNTAYVVAAQNGAVMFSRTTNGGQSWTTPRSIGQTSDAEISVDSFGDSVYVMVSSGGAIQLLRNTHLGDGDFLVTDVPLANAFHDVLVDKLTGDIILATDTPAFHLSRSSDGGLSFSSEANPNGSAFFSDWAGSAGLIYAVGTSGGSNDIDVISVADLAVGTSVTGLVEMSTSQARAIDADAFGNAYVASQQDDGTIQVDRMLVNSGEILAADVRNFGTGLMPGIAALPSNNGAIVVYTVGTDVFVTIEVY